MAAPVLEPIKIVRKGPDRLVAELQACWTLLADLAASLSQASAPLRDSARISGTLDEVRDQFASDTLILLTDPLESFLHLRPIRRSLDAMQEFDLEANSFAVRKRAPIDKRFQLLLATSALDLCEPWRIRRGGGHADEWAHWEQRRARRAKIAAALLARYQKWALRYEKIPAKDLPDPDRQKRIEDWWRQQRSVNAILEMELSLRSVGLKWFDATSSLVSSLRHERQEILSIAAQTVDWLNNGAPENVAAPADSMQLATPDERLRGVASQIEDEANRLLPAESEFVRPGRQTRWRAVKPQVAFLAAFNSYCRPPMQRCVFEYWEGSASVAREVSRSKEIIDYWRTAAVAQKNASSSTLFEDARHNAAVMLAEQTAIPPAEDALEPKLVEAFWNWSAEGSAALEAAQFGYFTLLQTPRGRRLINAKVRSGREAADKGVSIARLFLTDRWNGVMETLGGKIPPRPALEPVVRRSTLRDTLALPASKGELPPIYQSLFRLSPIEDRRFLVGRDQELSGLEQALKDWDAGRFAACLMVGARGSGKTSLLNCAAAGAFHGRELIRGQFEERTLTPSDLDAFLRRLINVDESADLAAAFDSQKRILMIEEAERTYLRRTGGFQAALHLIHWIHRTAATTLWIIVMNDKAFRVLDAGVQFGRVFSHRINAMNVSREHLENAVLERHRLSGLRLEFAPPPAGDPRVSRVKQFLRMEESPQKLYFDSLFQQSGGVFRSAFELWQSSIERVEGETLKIRQPLEPAFARFRSELAQEDHFTLLAIQEHGSLTREEVASVLYENEIASRMRLDRLLALGLIELDPEHPGWRVRPDASRFANDVLRRINLA